MAALPQDEEPGFAFLFKEEVDEMAEQGLNDESQYKLVSNHVARTQDDMKCVFAATNTLGDHLAAPELTRELRTWADTCRTTAKLQFTVKTHKPQRQVGTRTIHSMSDYKYVALVK